jgi:hypothetical protein
MRSLHTDRLTRLTLLSLATAMLMGDAAPGSDWWRVPIGANLQGVTQLFVDRGSIVRTGSTRTAWIFETFNPATTQTTSKKENLAVDCSQRRYRGLGWQWVDQDGTVSQSAESDVHWNSIEAGTPMDYAAAFICSQ